MFPSFSGDLPAIRELIQHEITGLLVDGANVAELSGYLERLESDPAARQRLGSAGRARVIRGFTLEMNIDRLERALRQALQHVSATISRFEA